MSTAKHSPTPWKLHPKIPNSRHIYAADETPVCECDSAKEALRAVESANAALIVKSVNLHNELVAALEMINEFWECDEPVGAHSISSLEIKELLKKARL